MEAGGDDELFNIIYHGVANTIRPMGATATGLSQPHASNLRPQHFLEVIILFDV